MKTKIVLPSSGSGVARGIVTLALLVMLLLAAIHLAPISVVVAGEPKTTTPDFAAIDKFIKAQMQAQGIPGLALGIVHGNQIVHLKGFGLANPSGQPVMPQTPFVLGSTSKSFTALAIMQLVEVGKVELDAPAQRYIPWFRVADEAASAEITVRHLLNQTSGFSTAAGRKESIDFDPSPQALENRVRRLREVELTQPVGSTYQYSNCNYQVLGLIVQMVSGQEYGSYVQEHILAPLDMSNSFTSKEEAQQHGLAMGHRSWFGVPRPFDEPFPRGSVPQGFIISSAEDMAHYLIAQLNEGWYGNTSVLSPAGMAELHRPGIERGDEKGSYGMGWEVSVINNDIPAVWHDGDTFSFHSFMVFVPGEQWGVVVLSNANNIPATVRFQEIAPGIINLLMGRRPIVEHTYDSLIVHSIVFGFVALQLMGIIWSVILLRRWRDQPQRRPHGWLSKGGRIALPLLLNLLWALLILGVLPQVFAPWPAFLLGMPGLGHLLLVSGLVALAWGILRTALAFLLLRERGAANTAEILIPV